MASAILSLLATGLFMGASVSAASCSKYTVEGSQKAYQFNHYSFQDFRNQTDNSYLSGSTFKGEYSTQTWNNEYFTNQASNVQIAQNDTTGESMLRLTAARTASGERTAAEIDSINNDIYYASVRIAARVTGAPGACAGLFFYHNDTQETDIEILTMEKVVHVDADTQRPNTPATTSQLHLTNQGLPHSDTVVSDLSALAGDLISATAGVATSSKAVQKQQAGSWEEFNIYRIDWIPGTTYWWQNGELSHSSQKFVIEQPATWIVNMWSNGQSTWTGEMAEGSSANLDIMWIEMAYNKFEEGAPQVIAAGQQSANSACTLSSGDGTNLLTGAGASSTTSTPGSASSAGSSSSVASSPSSSPDASSQSDPLTESSSGSGSGTNVVVTTVTVTEVVAPTKVARSFSA